MEEDKQLPKEVKKQLLKKAAQQIPKVDQKVLTEVEQ